MERQCKKRKLAASEELTFACIVNVNDVPDDLLRLILLRLDSPLWLVRAACACKRWRRIVAGGDGGRAFLRLARSLHPPFVVGNYHSSLSGGGHRFVPSSPAPPVRPSIHFFPRQLIRRHDAISIHWRNWHIADCHGGLVLLHDGFNLPPRLVVCEPLSGRSRCINHPLPSSGSYNYKRPNCHLLDNGNISISNFRVLYYCSTHSGVTTDVYVYSSADGGNWRFVRQSTADHGDPFGSYNWEVIGRIDRSLYMASRGGSVRVLDNARLEFSEVDLPIRKSGLDYDCSTFAVVHGASPEPTASPATAYIIHVCGDYLELFRRIPNSGEWVLEHSIPRLSEATRGLKGYPERSRSKAVDVLAGGTRLAVLRVHLSSTPMSYWFFSLDVDTMQLQVVPKVEPSVDMKPITCTLPWPRFLKAVPS